MPPSIKIFRARFPEDLSVVQELMRNYAAHLAAAPNNEAGICIAGFEQELAGLPGPYAEPAGCVLLASVDGRPFGCVAMKPLSPKGSTLADEKACEMKRLWTEPSARGLGLGRSLIEAAIQWARETSHTTIYLDTVPAVMPAAVSLYTAFGFEEVGRYNDNPVPGIIFYRKFLG